jgi:hypothetical protein
MPSGRFLHPQHPFAQVSKFLDCNSAMSRSRQSLAGSLIADFTVVVQLLAQNPRIRDLALTTNGALLPTLSSANSAVSRLIKNRSSNHDARYNDFAG